MYAELTRICKRCEKEKNVDEFYKSTYKKKKSGGHQSFRAYCKPCEVIRHREYVQENNERINKYRKERYSKNKKPSINQNLKRYYGISIDEYERMFKEQNGKCALCFCGQDVFSRRFDVDHCHKTGRIRGLLCIKCNRGLGLLQDNEEILSRAIVYLKGKK